MSVVDVPVQTSPSASNPSTRLDPTLQTPRDMRWTVGGWVCGLGLPDPSLEDPSGSGPKSRVGTGWGYFRNLVTDRGSDKESPTHGQDTSPPLFT